MSELIEFNDSLKQKKKFGNQFFKKIIIQI